MILKIVGIIIIGFLLAAGFPVGCDSIQTTDELAKEDLEDLYPVMSDPIFIQFPGEFEEYPISLIDTPAAFSWKAYDDVDLTTPARNQGYCGSCWAFGALGVMESVINIREGLKDIDLDLSEQYLLSCIPAAGSCSGGRSASPFRFIINRSADNNFLNGVIFEECLPYEADDTIPCSSKTEYWLETLVPFSGYGEVWFEPNNPDAVDAMKSMIYQNGPIYVLMTVDDSFRYFGGLSHRSTDYFHYKSLNVDFLNHAVIIVGWEDDPAIRNGGYWICKNSWGTDWGYDGFFNIEYGAMNIQTYMAWVEYDPSGFDCPPVADAGGFYQGVVGESLVFDGSESFDAENENLVYVWDFGEGATGEGSIVSHVFSEPGCYTVVLSVTDDHNHTVCDTTIVCIDTDVVSFDFSGGYGISVTIENYMDCSIPDTLVSIEVSGGIQNIDQHHEAIPEILSHETYEFSIPVMGFGRGTLHLSYASIEVTRVFFSVGPLIFIR